MAKKTSDEEPEVEEREVDVEAPKPPVGEYDGIIANRDPYAASSQPPERPPGEAIQQ